MSAELVRKLSALGLDLEQVAGVMDIMDAEAENRREMGRKRWHKWKETKDTNVSKRLQTDTNVSSQLTRVEDSSSKEDITGKKERKEGRSQATRLPSDWELPKDWLIEATVHGMTAGQAIASATRMLNWSLSDPKGKKLDWRATWRNWFQRDLPKPNSTASPNRRRNYADVAMDAFAGKTNGTEGIFGNNGDAQRLPARRIESRPDDGNLQSGIGRRVVQIDH